MQAIKQVLKLFALSALVVAAVLFLAIPAQSACDPSYPTVCIAPAPPDLDCKDIPYRYFPVLPPDPHHFDGGIGREANGIGCEIPPRQGL